MQDVMTPEEYEILLSLGSDNAQLSEDMKMQMMQAEQLRTDMPQGQMAGRVYVAPNILQYAGKMAGDNVARKKEAKAAEYGRTMGTNTTAQNRMIMQGILKGAQPTAPAMGVPEQGANPYDRFRLPGGAA